MTHTGSNAEKLQQLPYQFEWKETHSQVNSYKKGYQLWF